MAIAMGRLKLVPISIVVNLAAYLLPTRVSMCDPVPHLVSCRFVSIELLVSSTPAVSGLSGGKARWLRPVGKRQWSLSCLKVCHMLARAGARASAEASLLGAYFEAAGRASEVLVPVARLCYFGVCIYGALLIRFIMYDSFMFIFI